MCNNIKEEGGRSREGNLELGYANTLYAYKPDPAALLLIFKKYLNFDWLFFLYCEAQCDCKLRHKDGLGFFYASGWFMCEVRTLLTWRNHSALISLWETFWGNFFVSQGPKLHLCLGSLKYLPTSSVCRNSAGALYTRLASRGWKA